MSDPARGCFAVAAIVYAFSLFVFFHPALIHRQVLLSNDIATNDLEQISAPYRVTLGRALRRFSLPLWSDRIAGGFPLLAEGQGGLLYLPQWPILALWPDERGVALSIAVSMWIAAMGMHWLCLRLGSGRGPALLCGFCLSMGGFFMGHLRHGSMLDVTCWIPVVAALLHKACRDAQQGRGSTAFPLLALCFALQALAGHPPMLYMASLFYCCWTAALALSLSAGRRAFLARTAIAVLAGALLAGPQLLPTFELSRLSNRAGGLSLEKADPARFHPVNFLFFFSPSWLGSAADDSFFSTRDWGIHCENLCHIGFFPLVAALMAFNRKSLESPFGRFFPAAVLVSGLLALGTYTPVFRIARLLPYFDRFRLPSRFLLLASISLLVCASRQFSENRRLRRFFPLIAFITVLELFHHATFLHPFGLQKAWSTPPPCVQRIKKDCENPTVASVDGPTARLAVYIAQKGWAGAAADPAGSRAYANLAALLIPNTGLFWNIRSVGLYPCLVPKWLMERCGPTYTAGKLRSLAVTHVLRYRTGPDEPDVDGAVLEERYPGGIELWRVTAPLPQVFPTRSAVFVPSWESARNLTFSGRFDPTATAVLSSPAGAAKGISPPTPGRLSMARLKILESAADHIKFSCEGTGRSAVVISRTWYPGWMALLDGRIRLPVYQANGSNMGIVVPAGKHTVSMDFSYNHRGCALLCVALGCLLLTSTVLL